MDEVVAKPVSIALIETVLEEIINFDVESASESSWLFIIS